MFCTDDCHPDDLQDGYIEKLFRKALHKNYPIQNIISAATINAIEHFKLNVGYLRQGDSADFIVVDNLKNFTIQKTIIGGVTVFSSNNFVDSIQQLAPINNFYSNEISADDIKIKNQPGKSLHVIEVVPDSLLTKRITISDFTKFEFIEPDTRNDILKIVVVNRYEKAKPAVGFIKGIGIKTGAIGGSVAHDSHNIIVIGADDVSILKAIAVIQKGRGGLVAITGSEEYFLPLPIAGLMSDKSCSEVALEYKTITTLAQGMGSTLKSPYMTMAFMALLVIPELKIGDQGLFDVNTFSLIDLQS
jgi:adenine deaminase